jgi:hypothetical protein
MDDEDIVSFWLLVRDAICAVSRSSGIDWSGVSLYHLHRTFLPAPDELDLTVIIYCSLDSPKRLDGLQSEIRSVLKLHHVSELKLELIDGNVSRYSFNAIPSYDRIPVPDPAI